MSTIPVYISMENLDYCYPDAQQAVFSNFSLDLPEGVISLVGQNGCGKSTLMLLAAGRLLPTKGRAILFGQDTKQIQNEEERNRMVSFIYQNLEFETEQPLGELLEYVLANGYLKDKDSRLLKDIIKSFELEAVLNKKTQELSKGGLQRAIMAFSLLYGSKAIMMDEPVFALEEYQKKQVMGFMTDYARAQKLPLIYSAHELELTRKYSDFMLLLFKDNSYIFGPSAEVCTDQNIEKAFGIPASMLHQKEYLHRKHLLDITEHLAEDRAPFN